MSESTVTETPLQILKLEVNNILRLEHFEAEPAPDGGIVILEGANGAGKSSAFEAIRLAAEGARALKPVPVHQGAEQGDVFLVLGHAGTPELLVRRVVKGNRLTATEVTTPDGLRLRRPQEVLDRLKGALSFDPLRFAQQDQKEAAEFLRGLVGLDTTDLDAERDRIYSERTAVNREVRQLEGALAEIPVDPKAPEEEKSVAELMERRKKLESQSEARRTLEDFVRSAERDVGDARQEAEAQRQLVERIERDLALAREDLERLETDRVQAEAALEDRRRGLEAAPEPDFTAVDEELRTLEAHNERVRNKRARAAKVEQIAEKRTEADRITRRLEKIEEERQERVRKANMPIDGLSFGDQGVLYRGYPLDQASAAERLRVSVAVGAALNPRLRVMLVEDASLLDGRSLTLLREMAQERGYQLWLERVGDSDEVVVRIEEGAAA